MCFFFRIKHKTKKPINNTKYNPINKKTQYDYTRNYKII